MVDTEITTGVDRLISLIDEKKRISMSDAAKELSVPKVVIEEWSDFLHQQGVIDIEYKFTTPFLVKRELSQDEVDHKSKDFEGRKEGFVRKVEAAIDYINKESSGLKRVKEEFNQLGRELEEDVKRVREELSVLENYEQLKRNIDKEILEQQNTFKQQMDSVEKQILEKQKNYDELVSHVKEQELKIDEEINKTNLIKKNEDILKSRIKKLESITKTLEKQIDDEDADIDLLRNNIGHMKRYAEKIRQGIEMRKNEITPLMTKSKDHQKKIEQVQNDILKKIIEKRKKISDTVSEGKKAREKFEQFFDEKVEIDILMDKVNTDLSKLKGELDALVAEARLLGLATSKNMGKQIDVLETRFKNAEDKRAKFEGEIINLGRLISGNK